MSQFYSGKYKNGRKDATFRPYDVIALLQKFFVELNSVINSLFSNTFEAQFEPSFKLRWCRARFVWIANSSDRRRVRTANFLHTKYLPIPLEHEA